MALRFRRGSESDRTNPSFVPEDGEPIWIVDTKQLYIGDGSTAGGVLVTGSGGGGSTPGIDDNTTGVVLTLDNTTSTFTNDVELDGTDLLLAGGNITGTGNINILGNITGSGTVTSNIANIGSINVTSGISAGATITAPFFVGDHLGSVFADNSTMLVDGVAGSIVGPIETDYTSMFTQPTTVKIESVTAGSTAINLNGFAGTKESPTVPDDFAKLGIKFAWWDGAAYTDSSLITGFHRTSGAGYIGLTSKNTGGTYYATSVEIDGENGKVLLVGENAVEVENLSINGSVIDTTDSSGITFGQATTFTSDVTVENDLIVNNTLTCNTLEVTNFTTSGAGTPELTSDTGILLTAGTRVEVTQSPFKVASFTTAERDALTAENGDIIYNTTDNKFQGYENGAWANLI